MRLVGYARVSIVDQETRLQRDALKSAGVHLTPKSRYNNYTSFLVFYIATL